MRRHDTGERRTQEDTGHATPRKQEINGKHLNEKPETFATLHDHYPSAEARIYDPSHRFIALIDYSPDRRDSDHVRAWYA